MKETLKNLPALLKGSALSASAAIVSLIIRGAVNSEMKGIENSYAAIVQVGSEQMSRAEYLDYASGIVAGWTVAAVMLLVLAAGLAAVYFKKTHPAAFSMKNAQNGRV